MGSTGDPAPGPATAMARRRRKKVLVILLALAVIGGGWFTWDSFIRPRTMSEVLEGGPYQSGTTVRVSGTITDTLREETSYGSVVALELDDPSLLPFRTQPTSRCGSGSVRGDPNASYEVGDRLETVLHFESYRLHGDPAVWSPELVCWFPGLFRAVGTVIDAISQVAGIVLLYNGTDTDGWSRYEIRTVNGTRYDPNVLPVDLLKAMAAGVTIDSGPRWKEAASRFYVRVSAALGPDAPDFSVADHMTSLAAASSTQGNLRFIDADADGLVNSGDRLDVRLPPTGSSNDWDSYLVRIGNWSAMGPGDAGGSHIILLGPAGPFEVLVADRTPPA